MVVNQRFRITHFFHPRESRAKAHVLPSHVYRLPVLCSEFQMDSLDFVRTRHQLLEKNTSILCKEARTTSSRRSRRSTTRDESQATPELRLGRGMASCCWHCLHWLLRDTDLIQQDLIQHQQHMGIQASQGFEGEPPCTKHERTCLGQLQENRTSPRLASTKGFIPTDESKNSNNTVHTVRSVCSCVSQEATQKAEASAEPSAPIECHAFCSSAVATWLFKHAVSKPSKHAVFERMEGVCRTGTLRSCPKRHIVSDAVEVSSPKSSSR